MAFQMVWLWTDVLLWFLVFAIAVAMAFMRRDAQWWSSWLRVFHSRQGVVCGLILMTFMGVALLDSIHFRLPLAEEASFDGVSYDSTSVSVLDLVLWPVGQEFEETYSAPLSLHLFVKKMMLNADDQFVLDYPRLLWGGAPLTDVSQRADNIAHILMMAFLKATVAWVVVMACLWANHYSKRKKAKLAWKILWRDAPKEIPRLTAAITIAVILVIVFSAVDLSAVYHLMGTDKIGMDVFYQGIKSIRTGLIIGTVTTLFMLPFAVIGGMLAGYFRGWTDDVIQYIYSTLNAIPSVLLIAAAALVLQLYIIQHADWFPTIDQRADARLLMLCVVLGLTNWTTLCRLLRGETLKLRQADYVLAARTMGVPSYKILWRHILPNVLPLVIVVMVLDFSSFVLMEAVLSYVGVGVDPTTSSWGNMINRARLELARDPTVWWSLATAFILMFTLVLAANLFADKVRDAFDPKLRQV